MEGLDRGITWGAVPEFVNEENHVRIGRHLAEFWTPDIPSTMHEFKSLSRMLGPCGLITNVRMWEVEERKPWPI
jgi:hypothetical protein